MATTVSAWAKPGAWALDSEENEMEMLQQKEEADAGAAAKPSADFPSLAAATATKTSKKKKGQKVSLAEFNSGGLPVGPGAGKFQVRSASLPAPAAAAAAKGLTADERLMLPTGPRERTEEELERGNSRGFGYSYSSGGGRSRMGGEDSVSRWDSSRVSGEEPRRGGFDLAPSRADEIDDWGASKRSAAPPMERRERSGGFFDSQSRADESDSWISNKSVPPPVSDSRKMGDGFRERRGFDMFNREAANGGGRPDSESWGRRREDVGGGERPRLKLQPRTLPLANGDGEQRTDRPKSSGTSPFGAARPREAVLAEKGIPVVSDDGDRQVEQLPVTKSKGVNPFGAARPREEVLAKKGQDWKEIEERLESMKVREATSVRVEGHPLAKKGFGLGNGPGNQPGDQTERSWRKPEPVDAPPAAPSKGVNPFGAARPREEVLAEKGQDWKEIEERLESMKVREATSVRVEGHPLAKKGFGLGNGPGNQSGDQTGRSWRKPEPVDAPPAAPRFEALTCSFLVGVEIEWAKAEVGHPSSKSAWPKYAVNLGWVVQAEMAQAAVSLWRDLF
ncbi:hypothetical protein Taro_029615 [Colocasia esculenta]|uniref:Eukaryotic translation initiation factor 4B3 n=1 Tax=Colocasia esculenta TaxID=4460 RepID=A0A843W0T4_COLES|nr:hypothetical protein [Colocasia esculenta]